MLVVYNNYRFYLCLGKTSCLDKMHPFLVDSNCFFKFFFTYSTTHSIATTSSRMSLWVISGTVAVVPDDSVSSNSSALSLSSAIDSSSEESSSSAAPSSPNFRLS